MRWQRANHTMQLNKYVYFAHGWTLGYTDKPLIKHDVESWRNSPIIPEIYEAKDTPGYLVRGPLLSYWFKEPYESVLTEEEGIIVNNVYKDYGHLDSSSLIRISRRKDAPWKNFSGKRYDVIPDEQIKSYYKKLIAQMNARTHEN